MSTTLAKLSNVNVAVAKDGQAVGIQLTTAVGESFTFGVDGPGFNVLLSTLIDAMGKLGEITAPPEGAHNVTTRIIDAAAFSFSPGRSPTEMFAGIEIGSASLIFAVPSKDVVQAFTTMPSAIDVPQTN